MSRTRAILKAAATLVVVGLISVGLLALIHQLTRDAILRAEQQAERDALSVVLSADQYDNDPLSDAITVVAPGWLGSTEPLHVLRARSGGAPSALVITAIAPDGYAGPIQLLVGVDVNGVVTGARVTRHAETPGLGDKIDARKGPWINSFTGRSLGNPSLQQWKVRKDRGDFDQFAGATITPRAVVAAVARVLQYAGRHADELYDAPAGSQLNMRDAPDAEPAASATVEKPQPRTAQP